MKKSFRFLLAFTVLLSINGQAADPSGAAKPADGVEEKAPAAPQWKDTQTYRETRLQQLLFEALTQLKNDKGAREDRIRQETEGHEKALAEKLAKFQMEIKAEEEKLPPLKAELAIKQGNLELRKATVSYKKSWRDSSWPEYNEHVAALQALNEQENRIAQITATNKELSDAAQALKDSAVQALTQENAQQRSELITKTDAELSKQIDEGYVKAVEFFRANREAHIAVVERNPENNPLRALLEEGLFNSAFALTDFHICIKKNDTFESLVKTMLGEEKVHEFMDIYSRDQLEASQVLVEAVAAKQKVPVVKKKDPAAAAGVVYRLLNRIWQARNQSQEPVKDEALEKAETAAQEKARKAFLDGHMNFIVAAK